MTILICKMITCHMPSKHAIYICIRQTFLSKPTRIAFKVCISTVHAFSGYQTYDLHVASTILYCLSYRNTLLQLDEVT